MNKRSTCNFCSHRLRTNRQVTVRGKVRHICRECENIIKALPAKPSRDPRTERQLQDAIYQKQLEAAGQLWFQDIH